MLKNEVKKLPEKIGNEINKGDKKDFGFISTLDSVGMLLNELLITIPGVKAAAIVSMEGHPIVSALPRDVDEFKIAALTATILSLAERAINEMNTGDLEQLCIQGSILNFIVLTAGKSAVLTVTTIKNVNLGLIFLECRRICEKISKLI